MACDIVRICENASAGVTPDDCVADRVAIGEPTAVCSGSAERDRATVGYLRVIAGEFHDIADPKNNLAFFVLVDFYFRAAVGVTEVDCSVASSLCPPITQCRKQEKRTDELVER